MVSPWCLWGHWGLEEGGGDGVQDALVAQQSVCGGPVWPASRATTAELRLNGRGAFIQGVTKGIICLP